MELKKITLQEIKEMLIGGINTFANLRFTKECETEIGQINFKEIFDDLHIKSSYLSFDNCVFDLMVWFNDSMNVMHKAYTFHFDNESFHKVVFNRDVSFTACRFSISSERRQMNMPFYTDKFFEKVTFEADALFISCLFADITTFVYDVRFNGKVIFNDILFNENVSFSQIDFAKEVNFDGCTFQKNFSVFNVNFNGGLFIDTGVNLGRSSSFFNGYTEFNCLIKNNVAINNVTFNRVNFSQLILRNAKVEFTKIQFSEMALFRSLNLDNFTFVNCDLTNSSFLFSNIGNALFSSCTFDLKNLLDDKFLEQRDNPDISSKQIWSRYGMSMIGGFTPQDLLRQLKQFEIYFDRHKDYELSGEFYKKSLEIQSRDKKNLFKFIVLKAYDIFSEYGESYKRAFCIFCLTILLFAFIYLFTGVIYIDRDRNIPEFVVYYFEDSNSYNFLNDFGISFLYSISNSLPLRKELDIVKSANGLTTLISYFQTAIQTIIATLFVFALRRKFKRD